METRKQNEEINCGCGCITMVIAFALLALVCDLLGCRWSRGFADRTKALFSTTTTQQKGN